jgi:hypothetical protein
VDVGDVIEPRADLLTQGQRRLDRRVPAPAAWIGLEAVAERDEVVAAAEILERIERDRQSAGEGLEEARAALER